MKVLRSRYVIAVPDLKRSAAFYSEVLGFDIESIADPGWLFYHHGACTIMAGECPEALPATGIGDHSYFAYLEIDDAAGLHLSLVEAGVRICKPLRDEPWGMREFGIVTADGHRIMFASAHPAEPHL